MKTSKDILGHAALCMLVLGCSSTTTSNQGAHWQHHANQVTVGMTRSQVEKLLPALPQSPHMTFKGGGSQGEVYWLDTNWLVRVTYDYTGIPRDSRGQAVSTKSPQNKLLAPPTLFQTAMPSVDVKTISALASLETTVTTARAESPQTSQPMSNATITVTGYVVRAYSAAFQQGMTLRRATARAGLYTDGARGGAHLFRDPGGFGDLGGNYRVLRNGEKEFVFVNLESVIDKRHPDIVLKPGDVIVVEKP